MAIKSVPRKVFGNSRAPVKFTRKNDVIFSVPKFSCALRNTRKLFRGLYGTVFGPEKFSGLLRNARLAPVVQRVDNAIHRINRYPVDMCCTRQNESKP